MISWYYKLCYHDIMSYVHISGYKDLNLLDLPEMKPRVYTGQIWNYVISLSIIPIILQSEEHNERCVLIHLLLYFDPFLCSL